VESWEISVIIALLLYLWFRRRLWGWLDPLFLFLSLRIATAITVVAQYLFNPDLAGPGLLHMTLCLAIFTTSLWLYSPKTRPAPPPLGKKTLQARHLLGIGLVVLVCKLFILLSVYNELPIIMGETGSDSYIEFDMSNKVASSLLLGFGSFDTVLLACCTPLLTSKKEKYLGWFGLLVSIAVTIATPKKATILNVVFAIALGEYLRLYFFDRKARMFIKPVFMGIGGSMGLLWAYFVYSTTVANVDFDSVNDALNFVCSQFMYPYSLYASGDIYDFASFYNLNPLLYFFHSVSSLIDYPAFTASIGPSLHEYYGGSLSGHGINETFIIEGYIVFGRAMSLLYALFLGVLLGWARRIFLLPPHNVGKVALTALLLPPMYVLPVSSLLAIKMLIVCSLLIAGYVIVIGPLRSFMTVLGRSREDCLR